MHILFIITSIQKASGATSFCGGLANQLASEGHEVTIAIMSRAMSDEKYQLLNSVQIIPIETLVSRIGEYDVAHVHGIWNYAIHRSCVWLRGQGIPYVISPHGSLAPWAMRHHAWKKWIAWFLMFRRDMMDAAAIHVTAEIERDWLTKFGLGGIQPIVCAPLGNSLEIGEVEGHAHNGHILLFVGRVYPVKALDQLVKAFSILLENPSGKELVARGKWVLRIVGPDQSNHMSELIDLCDRLNLPCSTPASACKQTQALVQFVGPKYDAGLEAEFASCDALALVSHTENFGATVVDALMHGKPVITSVNTPWCEVREERCGWWVDNDPNVLTKALGELMSLSDEERFIMGRNGKALAERKYTWNAVAKSMLQTYENVFQERK